MWPWTILHLETKHEVPWMHQKAIACSFVLVLQIQQQVSDVFFVRGKGPAIVMCGIAVLLTGCSVHRSRPLHAEADRQATGAPDSDLDPALAAAGQIQQQMSPALLRTGFQTFQQQLQRRGPDSTWCEQVLTCSVYYI